MGRRWGHVLFPTWIFQLHTPYILYIYICKTNKSRSDDWADPVEETLLFLHGERTFHSSLGNCRWVSKSERPSVRLSVLAKKYVVDRSEKIHAWETKFVTGTRSLTASQPRRRLSKFKVQRCPEATLPWQRRCLALLFLFVFFLVVLCFAWLFQSGLLAFIRFASGSVSRVSLICFSGLWLLLRPTLGFGRRFVCAISIRGSVGARFHYTFWSVVRTTLSPHLAQNEVSQDHFNLAAVPLRQSQAPAGNSFQHASLCQAGLADRKIDPQCAANGQQHFHAIHIIFIEGKGQLRGII